MKAKRIAALIGVILLVLMYLTTLISAIISKGSTTKTLFSISLVLTVTVPIVLWLFIWMVGRMTGKRTIASPPEVKLPDTDSEDSKPLEICQASPDR